jgi:hypothetical protein
LIKAFLTLDILCPLRKCPNWMKDFKQIMILINKKASRILIQSKFQNKSLFPDKRITHVNHKETFIKKRKEIFFCKVFVLCPNK